MVLEFVITFCNFTIEKECFVVFCCNHTQYHTLSSILLHEPKVFIQMTPNQLNYT